jgi:hypothetical protein
LRRSGGAIMNLFLCSLLGFVRSPGTIGVPARRCSIEFAISREGFVASVNLRDRILDRRGQEPDETVRRQAARLRAMPELCHLLDALPDPILILNEKRKIVFANNCLLELIGRVEPECVHGLRPGDVLDCDHAWGDGRGCGATEGCEVCGAACAIGCGEAGASVTQECRIIQTSGTALDLRAVSTPLSIAGESFTVLALADISHEKRRKVLERVFFHDILNMMASLMGYAELLVRVKPDEVPEIGRQIAQNVLDLAEELRAHRDLSMAEARDLQVRWESVRTRQIMNAVIEASRRLEVAEGRQIVLPPTVADVAFPSDKSLLIRVLGNLIKNALEATRPGETVTVGCEAKPKNVDFWVHNQGVMPRDVQLQVFQRSFSTKGVGRGLGTYSVKLLTEQYLRGHASFTSGDKSGTTFRVSYPRTHDERA